MPKCNPLDKERVRTLLLVAHLRGRPDPQVRKGTSNFTCFEVLFRYPPKDRHKPTERNLLNLFFTAFESPIDIIGFVLFLFVFPIYHGLYPWLARILKHAQRAHFDAFRESWIEGLIERRDVLAAAQQTRNLTMVNSVLVSSSLIFMGLTTNFLIQIPVLSDQLPHPAMWSSHPDALRVKLYFLIIVFALAFSFFMTSLRHLGHFVLVIGADPALIEKHQGSPVKYFSTLINRASHRYTLGMRSFYSAFPLFAWLFDPWMFLLLTAFWGIKFIGFQDFFHSVGKKSAP